MKRAIALVPGGFAAAALLLLIHFASATNLVQLQSPAFVRSRGAAVQVTVTVACDASSTGTVAASSTPATATLTVKLTEKVGNGTAVGNGAAASQDGDFPCDSGSHNIQ